MSVEAAKLHLERGAGEPEEGYVDPLDIQNSYDDLQAAWQADNDQIVADAQAYTDAVAVKKSGATMTGPLTVLNAGSGNTTAVTVRGGGIMFDTGGSGNPINVGIKWSSPDLFANVNNGAASMVIGSVSDRRVKDNIEPLAAALDTVAQLRPVIYTVVDAEDPTRVHQGLIADEVAQVLPAVVTQGGPETLASINYAGLVPLLLAAVQELQARINEMESN